MSELEPLFVEVIVPLAVEGSFTYRVPENLRQHVKIGTRVEVEFGKSKRYSGLILNISNSTRWLQIKDIIDVLDTEPIVTHYQISFWHWLAEYYVCSLGEIMIAALPSSYRLSSETIILRENIQIESLELSDDEYLILEALELRNSLSVNDIRSILQKKNVLRLIKSMMDKKLLTITESLSEQQEISKVDWIKLHDGLANDESAFSEALYKIQKSELQSRAVIQYLTLRKDKTWIRKKELSAKSNISSSVIQSLIKKNIFQQISLDKYIYPEIHTAKGIPLLSESQDQAFKFIQESWKTKDVCLLKGVTGSGKTHIYIQLIKETIAAGKQVLYLLPEIALTSQLVIRLKQFFGDELLEYHSGISASNRMAIWNSCFNNHPMIIGARSSIFLPFTNLGLIIIDEEHDQSYKQVDPAPRYNARDAAMVLAKEFHGKVLLGSATPSLESYYNAQIQKYSLCNLENRYGESTLPEIKIIPLKEAALFNRMQGHFSLDLIEEIRAQLLQNKQVLIFRNRRGYSPVLMCTNCHWESMCDRCDIHLTAHKQSLILKCHICGLRKPIPTVCPQCHQHTIKFVGFGTEKVEEELSEIFTDVNIHRFDLDTARSKSSQSQILEDFHDGNIQILIGTQMLTKGLDFEHVLLVGVLQTDQIFFYPDFRAQERAFQLLTQVSGRSGRREAPGKVYIQALNVHHPVLDDVVHHNHERFYTRELKEREKFLYPPFIKLIKIEVRHRLEQHAQHSIEYFAVKLKKEFGKRIIGPADSNLSKIKGLYAKELYLKIERNAELISKIKEKIKELSQSIKNHKDWKGIKIYIDVDPY